MANTVNVKKLVADISNLEVYSGEQYLEERQITTEPRPHVTIYVALNDHSNSQST